MHIHVYMCVYIYTHTYVHTHKCVLHVCVYIWIYIYIYIRTHICREREIYNVLQHHDFGSLVQAPDNARQCRVSQHHNYNYGVLCVTKM